MSRRNQKRVEHELKDLINERGNSNKCGECGAGFPTWASVNLGVFLCGRCASVHRNLGTDISVVKSLTLDKWTESDLEYLSTIGNKKAKQFWNPKGVPFPFDDEDKDEIYLYLRNKYVNGKFRYSPPTREDYNLDDSSSRSRSRSRAGSAFGGSSSRPSSRGVPSLSHRDIPEIERLKYRKLEPKLKDQGFRNTDDNYEALSLSRGDLRLAAEILRNSPDDSNEAKPALPRRPGTSSNNGTTVSASSQPTTASSEWWNGSSSTTAGAVSTPVSVSTGLIEPPQQYLDPVTGVIYVDPVQQQQYLLQQQQLEQQQLLQQQQLLAQQQTGVLNGAQQQFANPTNPYVQTQRTGIDKNQLLSLYNTGSQQQQQPAFGQQTGQQQPQFVQNQFLQGQQFPQQQQQQQYYSQNTYGFQ